MSQSPEILAPAGGMPVLLAALDAGADALYLGLKHFNARNGAQNFLPGELAEAVRLAHGKSAKVYLTLNTDLCQREIGMAVRSLALAAECGVDAVLVRDPALLAFHRFFPELPFHFSTQAGVSSSAGAEAAKQQGIVRVVLARELSFEEIRAVTAIPGIEAEVFIQGALCFSCSGRCLLSSWGGGRSGNRGSCASPCRVPWKNGDGVEARPMSMRDLCLVDWVDALAHIGVASLKIEGRLKTPAWVSRAVSLYRRAIDHAAAPEELRVEASTLGDYTGRDVTDGYLRGDRSMLTAESGRASSCTVPACAPAFEGPMPVLIFCAEDDRKATVLTMECGDTQDSLRIPPQRVPNARRASSVAELGDGISSLVQAAKRTLQWNCEAQLAEKLLPRSAVNSALDAVASFLRSLEKQEDGLPRGLELPAELKSLLARKPVPCGDNLKTLGQVADRLRAAWNCPGLRMLPGQRLIVDCNPWTLPQAEEQFHGALKLGAAIIALPQVMYEGQLPAMERLLALAVERGLAAEVNSWDGWHLARKAGLPMEGGPGLAVLNAYAAEYLCAQGLRSAFVAYEIDQAQLEDLCANSCVPLSLAVYARPPLMITRAELPSLFADGTLEDARGISLTTEHQGQLTLLRPLQPMDWRKLRNPKVKVAHLVQDWEDGMGAAPRPFLFNYDRRLR